MSHPTPHLLPATQAFLARSPHGLLIGERWRPASQGRTIESRDPATGQTLARFARADVADVDDAVEAARAGLAAWQAVSPEERTRILWRVADLIEAHIDELAQLETLDQGKPFAVGRFGEMTAAVRQFRYYAGFPTKITGQTLPVSVSPALVPEGRTPFAYTVREPVGVVAAIVPWNSPLLMAAMKLAPALAAGCAVILKPAEDTSLTAVRLVELLLEAGVPGGTVNLVTGYGHEVGQALAEHPGVNKVAFTGSTAVGKRLLDAAKGNLKRLTLELGGKSPAIVLPDADIELAAQGLAKGIFNNSGQVCVASSRIYAHRDVYDALVTRMTELARQRTLGHGLDPATDLGPLVSPEHAQRVRGYVRTAVDEGARVLTGGNLAPGSDTLFEPTLVTGVGQDARIMQEEVFGPVAVVTPFDSIDEVIAWANDSSYGLAASVWSDNLRDVQRLVAALDAGTVWVNCHSILGPDLPKGGHKQSGWGYENGAQGLENYLESKTVCQFT